MRVLAIVALLAFSSPALSAHCPHGQLYRIRMARCVSLASPLAFAYEGRRLAEDRSWYVEVTKVPPVDERTPGEVADQAEHDAAVRAYRDELNAELQVIRATEEGRRVLNDIFRRGE